MNFCDIKPYIRYVEKISGDECLRLEPKASYDHIMLYGLDGYADVSINNIIYRVSRGDVLIIKPGSFYTIPTQDRSEAIAIHFDFGSENSVNKGFYLEPRAKADFNFEKICEPFTIDDEECFNSDILTKGLGNIEETFKQIHREFNKAEKYFDFRISGYTASVLIEILRRNSIAGDSHHNTDDAGRAVLDYIHNNINANITVEELSKQFKFHSTYINILVKKLTGYPVHKYIMVRRISKAIELLQYSDMRISEIAEKVGFPDASHFSKVFKQIMGKSPREFRKN